MDGNGRWAQRRGLRRTEGHRRAKDAVRAVVETSRELGIEYLTLYAFSTENWQRPRSEVRALMSLFRHYLRTELGRMMEYNIRLRSLGNLERLPTPVQEAFAEAMRATARNTGLTVILAVSYGAREEIVMAARAIATAAREGRLEPQRMTEEVFARYLQTAGVPDPDLLIRTGGEFRLSNFLLWQIAYTELYITDILWPDFGRDEFLQALADYQQRQRRFGRTTEQHLHTELRRAAR